MGINFIQHSDWWKIEKALKRMEKLPPSAEDIIKEYADIGLAALKERTPVRTGKTAASWYYVIDNSQTGITTINYCNANINEGQNIAILIQYGHGTKQGAYIEGTDYINPVTRQLFKHLANDLYKEIQSRWRV